MSDQVEPPTPKRTRRARPERVHRKGPGRGWVYRWTEWDAARGKVVRRTSPEFEKKRDAELAEAAERMNRTLAKVMARKRRRLGGAQPLTIVLERWEASRLATRQAGALWTEEVKRTLTEIARVRRWRTVEDVTPDDVDQWIAQKGGVGVERPLDMLKSVLNYAFRVMKQPVDPHVLLMGIEAAPRPKAKAFLYEDEQLATILARCDEHGERVGTLARHILLLGWRPKTVVNLEVGDWDEVNRLLAAPGTKTKNREALLVAVQDDDLALRLSRLCAGRGRREKLYLMPSGMPWADEKGRSTRLTTWWPRVITWDFPRFRQGIYLLVDAAVSRMRQAGWDAAAIAATTGKNTKAVHDLYDATNRARQRELWRRLPVLPSPSAASLPRGQVGGACAPEAPTGTMGAELGAGKTLPPST